MTLDALSPRISGPLGIGLIRDQDEVMPEVPS